MIRRIAAAALLSILPAMACGQAAGYPSKALRILVPFTAGSGADSNSRFYGDLLAKLWGQAVVVDNRPGASGIIAVQAVKSAPADGYTLLTATNSPMIVNPVVMKDLPYDPFKDFRPIIGMSKTPVAFIVRADSPYKTIKDLIEGARKTDGLLAVGNYSAGYELVGAWLGTVSGLAITPVPYKGASPMITDVIGGQIVTAATDFGGAAPLITNGRLRALAITSDVRHPMFPDVPTMKESGFPEFETYVWSSIFVRAETPDDIVNRLYAGFKSVIASPEARAFQASEPRLVMNYTPQELRAFVVAEYERIRKVAQAAGIQPR